MLTFQKKKNNWGESIKINFMKGEQEGEVTRIPVSLVETWHHTSK